MTMIAEKTPNRSDVNEQFKTERETASDITLYENIKIRKGEKLDQHFFDDSISLFLVTEGHGKIHLNTQEVELKKNTLIQIPQYTSVTIKDQMDFLCLSGIRFSSDFVAKARIPISVLGVLNHFSSNFLSVVNLGQKEADVIHHQLNKLNEALIKRNTQAFGKELLQISFQKLLIKIGRLRQQYTTAVNLSYSPQECLYMKFSDLVQKQFKEERIIKKYADQLHVTAKYLGEAVKEHSGRNANRIIKELVISEAKFLLTDPELNISQIAERLNFSDVSTFGKYFKNETGFSPKQYKEKEIFLT